MQSVLLTVDRISAWIGKIFAWLIVALTLVVCYEIFVRRALRAPTEWAYDVSYMLYGTLFMMAGAYTLARNGHVRADFVYRLFSPRLQASFDLALYLVFFFPAIIALIFSGWDFFLQSYASGERSAASPGGPIIWPFKGVIPLVGVLMLAQGIAEAIRCVVCIRRGAWPQRLHDVEEIESVIRDRAKAEADGAAVAPGKG